MGKIKILVDVFGCDYPDNIIEGIAKCVNSADGFVIVAAGNRNYIENRLSCFEYDRERVEFLDAREIITNDDSPVAAIRNKKDSSLVKGLYALKAEEDIKAMVSAGSTGAVLCGAVLLLGKADGVERPALASVLPADNGKFVCIADCGANADCRPEHLVKFAEMASGYMKSVYGSDNPAVGLLSVGTEDKKGNELTKAAFGLLKESGLNFIGNAEGKGVLSGRYDVIAADGFTGNVLLKSIEGTAKSVAARALKLLKKHAPEGSDTNFVKNAFAELNSSMDFNSMGGAVLLGVKKIVVKAHGSANADTVVNTVMQALKMYSGGLKNGI